MTERRRSTTTAALERRKRNRRAFPRWLHDFEVRLSWERQSVACRGYEIGEGGLSVTCERSVPSEAEIDVEYRLDSKASPVHVKGVVRYIQSGHFGIEFLNLGIKDRLAIVEFCEKLKTI